MKFIFSKPLILAASMALASTLSVSSCWAAPTNTPVTALAPLPSDQNAAWIGHAFVTTQSVIATVPKTCDFMRDHQVTYWFVNLGLHDKEGKLSKGAAAVPRLREFLTAVNTWETANNHRFKILGWLNGSTDEASPRYINLSQPEVRQTMLEEVRRFSDPNVEGSYVSGAPRMLDGIQYDLEPSGADEVRFANLLTFMKELRTTLGPEKLTSFTPHKLGTTGRYWWSPEFYYRMAPEVDLLGAMTYDAGIKTEPAYREWMKKQTVGILQAVSGKAWNNDAAHPAPQKAAKIFIGFPAFPVNNWHPLEGETITGAIQGTQDALKELADTKNTSSQHFGGAGVYLYTDGLGKDGYSNPEQWAAFRTKWLGLP